VALPPTDPTDKAVIRRSAEHDMFVREVDEAVRQEDVTSFARKYGLPIGVALVVILLAFGGYLFWDNRQEQQLEQGSEELIGALDELEAGNRDLANTELAALADSDNKGAAAMAAMLRAGIALEENRTEDAVALYTGLIDNSDTPSELRDLALIRLMTARFDAVEPQEVIERVGPLAVPDNAYFGSAGELVAFAYLKQNKPDQAGPLLVAIAKDDEVPQSIRARTRQLAGLLGFDAIEDVEATLDELGAGGQPAAAPNP